MPRRLKFEATKPTEDVFQCVRLRRQRGLGARPGKRFRRELGDGWGTIGRRQVGCRLLGSGSQTQVCRMGRGRRHALHRLHRNMRRRGALRRIHRVGANKRLIDGALIDYFLVVCVVVNPAATRFRGG